jgi:hypothetical protein
MRPMTNNVDSIYDKPSHNFVQKGKTMFIGMHRGIVVAAAAVLLTACATTGQPVYNVSQSPVVASKARTTDDVGKAIIRAGVGLGWQMVADRPGHMVGTLKARTHVAVVDIDYNPKFYSIKYRESSNLNYDGANIHRNYNNWIQNLDRQIQVQLSTL